MAAGHPLDLIKVNMQTMEVPKAGEAPMYSSAVDCGRQIIAKDGVRKIVYFKFIACLNMFLFV